MKRRYVYDELYKEVMDWAEEHKIRSPNSKDNFPFYLQQFVNDLKFKNNGGK